MHLCAALSRLLSGMKPSLKKFEGGREALQQSGAWRLSGFTRLCSLPPARLTAAKAPLLTLIQMALPAAH